MDENTYPQLQGINDEVQSNTQTTISTVTPTDEYQPTGSLHQNSNETNEQFQLAETSIQTPATPKQTINTNKLKRTPIPIPIQPPQLDLETAQTVPSTPKVSLGREIQNIIENKTILSKRISKQPTKTNLTTEAEITEPETYQQAIHLPQAHKWINAMTEELEALAKNETWTMVTRPNPQQRGELYI